MRYDQIKPILDEEVLDEVKMSPSALQKFANSPEAEGMLVGIEFEMGVPDVEDADMEPEWEYDYDQNQSAGSVDEIINFFRDGEFSNLGRSSADRLRDEMYQQYQEWLDEKVSDNLDESELADRIKDRLLEELDWEDYVDQAEEELEAAGEMPNDADDPDARSQAINLKAKDLLRDAVDEIVDNREGRDYERAYDDIRDEMYDEMRNDGDYDEEAWLSDIGVDDMQDAEREWSLDWPHMYDINYDDYGGGADLDTVADEFSQAMGGVKVNTSSNYHGARRDGTSWIIEPDGSIDAERGDAGLEFVSPPMPLKQGLDAMQQFYAWAKERGCYTNKSTGLHMNISVPDLTVENLDYVKLALFLGDEYVLKQFGREYNNYAKSAMSKIRDRIRPEDVPAVLNQMKQHLNSLASKTIHSGITDKYTSINTKTNYVEFRGPGGDYLDMNPLELVNTALRAALALRIASNPESYKQEYAKKLYKLIGPKEGEWTDSNNSVALFSRYALGQINKSELIDNVRQAQVARKEKKGEEVQYWVMNKDGTGGKQMVFAASETAAIILGGKQIGMNREQSISKLRAELFEPGQDSTQQPMPDSVPRSWKEWVNDLLPNINVETANSVRQRIKDGGDNLDQAANVWIIQQIDAELRRRQDQGVVDGNETRWKVKASISVNNRNYDPVYVDADSPRQAKLKAVEIFRREQNLTISVDDLDAIATTQDAGRETANTTSREVFDSLPNVWQDYLQDVGSKSGSDLQRIIDNMAAGVNAHYTNLTLDQKDFVINTVNQELRRRSQENGTAWQSSNAELAAAAGDAENEVRASLPDTHREWLDNIANHSDMGIINVLRNNNVYQGVSEQAAAYFRIQLKRELRRRGINPDAEAPAQSANPYANDAAERERMAREREQLSVDMQTQLINRDDPVTSNDPEARSPIAQEGPGMWMVGNHTYGRETFRANSRDEAIQAYAERNDITVQDLTSDRSFVAQLTQPDQGELDLREMRRLAGLI